MTSTTNSSVKPTVCRYFSNGGTCYYGTDCSFTHANNTAPKPSSETEDFAEPIMSVNKVILDDAPVVLPDENCDTVAYTDAHINGLPSESKLHMFLKPQRSISTPSHSLIDEKPKQSSSLHASFSNMNLDSDSKLMSQNDMLNDFAVTTAPTTTTLSTNLRHSSSSPSFMSSTTPYGRYQTLSPNVSPVITPSQSPNVNRRTKASISSIPVSNSTDEAINTPLYQESYLGTTYYYTPDAMASQSNNSSNHELVNGSSNNVIIPDFHIYHSNPSHIEHIEPKANAHSYFMSDELKFVRRHRRSLKAIAGFCSEIYPLLPSQILQNNSVMNAQVDPEVGHDLPTEVDQYQNLCPLEPALNSQNQKTSTFGYVTTVYKATNIKTGVNYCLRRVHGFRLVHTKCMSIIEMWKKLKHSNLVQLREVFTTKAFGDHSIVFVHDYHPNATTLLDYHFSHSNKSDNLVRGTGIYGPEGAPRPFSQSKSSRKALLPESQLWAYIVQLSSVIRTIHMAGLACRNLDPTKVLITAKSRLRVNCCGIYDVLTYDINVSNSLPHTQLYQDLETVEESGVPFSPSSLSSQIGEVIIPPTGSDDLNKISNLEIAQTTTSTVQKAREPEHHFQTSKVLSLLISNQEDMGAFGKIILALACNSLDSVHVDNMQSSMELVARNYSPDLRNLILYLIGTQRNKSVNEIMPMIGARFYTQLDSAQLRTDIAENELAKEVNNGRLLRLITKINIITERPEFNMDHTWSETGDRYMLKLFRDYVFHLVTEEGAPWMDMSHIVQCLNKFDAGVPDKIILSSRDQQNVLVVSYTELKQCFETSFSEIFASTGQDFKQS
ncbi:PAN2-PAN3 deadenylation complex subunit pan3 [Nymphon striatum]|nr:PAN2-PAN3 deadenylation complex subunit pan3 [Nymphon striatum]